MLTALSPLLGCLSTHSGPALWGPEWGIQRLISSRELEMSQSPAKAGRDMDQAGFLCGRSKGVG
jgi:hypothetical protein